MAIDMEEMGKKAKQAARGLVLVGSDQKNGFLVTLADLLRSSTPEILTANAADIQAGRAGVMSDALVDRLLLNEKRIEGMAQDLLDLAGMPDPVGQVIEEKKLSSGLHASRVRVPLGVMAVIYEARPNVTIDISALGIKSGNAVILRGGKETLQTNNALVNLIHTALQSNQLDTDVVQFINDPDRALASILVKMDNYVDVLIPRGGNTLQNFCKKEATMPVMTGGIGICHLFVDDSADQSRALPVIFNAKVQRPSVCNALDTILVHHRVASEFLPKVVDTLRPAGVRLKLDDKAQAILGVDSESGLEAASDGDFDQEWLSLTLGICVVKDLDEAIDFIYKHSTFHSDGILTENKLNAEHFLKAVDSAAVYVNASTRFTDGAQLGLGGEVAVSTQRLHARGPVGLEALTTYKWVMRGDYTVRA
ncbi:MAG: glutamate-5-semialdehyde dehydrogenase [Chloroflexi bacterium HGW-Chloroflexi-10]|nr:MAG: glutamate-5-semialdehyde dehydrogenase [Chloroflexi bacterium HGW-Chloroflexi-10]